MAPPKSVRAPTTASLPNNLRIPSTAQSLTKTLNKLSRQALLDLALIWLDDQNFKSFPPYLQREETNNEYEEALPYPAAETIEEARQAYEDMQERKGGKREVVERILEGDWRQGITLRQLAMADIRYIEDHPASSRWTALELERIDSKHKTSTNSSTSEAWATHYHLARSNTLPLTFLRIFIVDSPYQSPRQSHEIFADASRIIYVAFPDSSPYIYTSVAITTGSNAKPITSSSSIATDPKSLHRLVREAVPKALSRPHERYTLKATALATKNLPTLLALRGAGRSTAANGSFSIFADAALEGSPLDPRPSNTVAAEEHMRGGHKPIKDEDKENNSEVHSQELQLPSHPKKRHSGTSTGMDGSISPSSKKRRLAVDSRFGSASSSLTPAPLDRLDIRLLDAPVEDRENDTRTGVLPPLSLTFSGADVIGGIRKLAELGVVDPERMPSWMTGEEAVSMAVVRGEEGF
ncbi:uncharacterized protein N7483_012119 [Penicillium malachiteum]|uniref:uncharacterized protein n=1 Tax=Penicillium malachiteum TaxID=1324776 RepID=UPI0025476B04|nr:uncharacterized protein N7483_012119 [Penicillium malachiteum]KAJ5714938.1 hypothetical protein N7483_012119 [Penicillium malachiteum]